MKSIIVEIVARVGLVAILWGMSAALAYGMVRRARDVRDSVGVSKFILLIGLVFAMPLLDRIPVESEDAKGLVLYLTKTTFILATIYVLGKIDSVASSRTATREIK